MLDGAGGTPRRVTRSSGSNKLPVFAPGGRRLIFVSDRTGNYELWRVDADGSGLKRLDARAQRRHRAVVARRRPHRRQLVRVRKLRAVLDPCRRDGKKVLAKDLSNDVQPAWSPDGRRIVYVRTCEVPERCMNFRDTRRDGDGELYVVPAAGGPQRALGRTKAVESDPRWSPSGRAIVFVSTTRTASNIAVVKPDGTGLKTLTAGRTDSDPQWSPNGRRIAFTSVRDGNSEIYVMKRRRLGGAQPDAEGATRPTRWSPDGRRSSSSRAQRATPSRSP